MPRGRPFRWPLIRTLEPAGVLEIPLLDVTSQSFERTIDRENRRREIEGFESYLVCEIVTRSEPGLGTHLVARLSCRKVVAPDAPPSLSSAQ